MTKSIFFAFAFIAFTFINLSALAQNNTDLDGRLRSKFSKKELKSLSQADIEYWTFYLNNSLLIVDLPKEKPDAVPATIKLRSLDVNELNVFELGLKPHEFARDYFKIEGTDKMVVVLPMTEIEKNYEASKK